MPHPRPNQVVLKRLNLVIFLLIAGFLLRLLWSATLPEPIKVGVLHSQTGPMAHSESGVINATLMAIDEINQQGGVMGHPLLPVLADGASHDKTFAEAAKSLLYQTQTPVIFGCWTSASRKAVLPVVDAANALLFYPVQYEGLEHSEHIVYSAEVPNQQIIPALSWIHQNLGQKIVLIGSDYVFPRVANLQIKKVAEVLGMTVLDESYFPLSQERFEDVQRLLDLKPDVIINTLNGDANRHFFEALAKVQTQPKVPVMSFSLSAVEAKDYHQNYGLDLTGHYLSWGYDAQSALPENQQFIQNYRQRVGQEALVNSPMVNAYSNVYLWKLAVEKSRSTDAKRVLDALHLVGFTGPAGRVYIDAATRHTWKPSIISVLNATGDTRLVWQSETLIKPAPYSIFETTHEASAKVLQGLYDRWGGAWQAPD